MTTLIAAALMVPGLLGPVDVALPPALPWAPLAAVLGLGIFSTAWASIIYFRLIKSAGPAFVSQLNYLIPLWAVLVGMAFLDERLQANQLYALALILGGILVIQMERRRAIPRSPGAPSA